MNKHRHKKTYYNDIALRLAERIFGVHHLHYGYFKKGIPVKLDSIQQAQDEYMKLLLGFLPRRNLRNILDVGCGTGGMALELLNRGYRVTCLAPDPFLIEKTRENTGGRVETITDLYENLEFKSGNSFDLVLMSESAQYICMEKGWNQSRNLVKPGGYVLVADFFKIRPLDNPDLSKSGHDYESFVKKAEENGFALIKEKDISTGVAPTMDLYQSVLSEILFPVLEAIGELISRRHPRIHWIGKRLLKKTIARTYRKYSLQDSGTFLKYKAYRILLFQNQGIPS